MNDNVAYLGSQIVLNVYIEPIDGVTAFENSIMFNQDVL